MVVAARWRHPMSARLAAYQLKPSGATPLGPVPPPRFTMGISTVPDGLGPQCERRCLVLSTTLGSTTHAVTGQDALCPARSLRYERQCLGVDLGSVWCLFRRCRLDPTGPSSGSDRVLRGGSWVDDAGDVRVPIVTTSQSARRNMGFRLAGTALMPY